MGDEALRVLVISSGAELALKTRLEEMGFNPNYITSAQSASGGLHMMAGLGTQGLGFGLVIMDTRSMYPGDSPENILGPLRGDRGDRAMRKMPCLLLQDGAVPVPPADQRDTVVSGDANSAEKSAPALRALLEQVLKRPLKFSQASDGADEKWRQHAAKNPRGPELS